MNESKRFTGSIDLELKATGAFEVRFATKRDAKGELVIDHHGDVYQDGAIGVQAVVIGCTDHGQCDAPVGMATTFETSTDIRAKGRLIIETPHGLAEWERWKSLGAKAEFSYTFYVQDSDRITVAGRDVRRLKKLHVVTVDQVARGAGIGTGIVDMKSHPCGCGGADWRKDVEAGFAQFREFQVGQQLREEMRKASETLKGLQPKAPEAHPAVAATSIPWALAVEADRWVKQASSWAGVPVPEIRWFKNAESGDRTLGYVREAGVVFLNAGLRPHQVGSVAAHEVGHLAGHDEPGAVAFSERVVGHGWEAVA